MPSGRKVRSNKGKKRGSYRTRKTHHAIKVRVNSKGNRRVSRRKTRSNKGKKRTPYGPRTGKTRSGRKFRQSGGNCHDDWSVSVFSRKAGKGNYSNPGQIPQEVKDEYASWKTAGCPFEGDKTYEGDPEGFVPMLGPPPCEPMDEDSCLREPTCHLRGDKVCVPCTKGLLESMGCKSAPGVTPQIRQ